MGLGPVPFARLPGRVSCVLREFHFITFPRVIAMSNVSSELLSKAIGGDEQALSQLLEEHGPAVRRPLAGAIPKRWQSLLSEDDVLQQTYVDAFRDIRSFVGDDGRAFESWLHTLAKRNMLDGIKMLEAEKRGGDRRRIEPGSRDESMVALYELLGGSITTPSRKAARQEAGEALKKALESLPNSYRQVIEMYDLEGCSIEEAAVALKRSSGATYMLRARAHRLLCEIMGTESKYLSEKA